MKAKVMQQVAWRMQAKRGCLGIRQREKICFNTLKGPEYTGYILYSRFTIHDTAETLEKHNDSEVVSHRQPNI
jgi:uncharacterized protein YjbK